MPFGSSGARKREAAKITFTGTGRSGKKRKRTKFPIRFLLFNFFFSLDLLFDCNLRWCIFDLIDYRANRSRFKVFDPSPAFLFLSMAWIFQWIECGFYLHCWDLVVSVWIERNARLLLLFCLHLLHFASDRVVFALISFFVLEICWS